jgi:hypothetical protein
LDADVFEHETQQLLAAVEVEGVDAVQGALGEVGDAGAQAVALVSLMSPAVWWV